MDIKSNPGILNLDIHFNGEGWGPVNGEKIPAFIGVPYAHFDKKDKIGRAADFVQNNQYQRQQFQRRRYDDMATDFAYRHDAAEDNTFQLVDTATKAQARGKHTANKRQPNKLQQRQKPRRDLGAPTNNNMVRGKKGNNSKFIRGKRGDRKQDRVPTLPVGAAWEVLEEFDLSQLLKLAANSPQVEDLVWCGALNEYDEAYDKISGRNPKNIRKSENKVFYSVTSQEDPILEGFAAEEKGNVFVTDTILAQLMAAPRSVYSWDIVVQKVGGMIFLDKRNDSNIDMLTVSETALDAPTLAEDIEEFNYPEALSQEATAINQNFSQQILRSGNLKSFEAHPFHDDSQEGEAAAVAYRYRKITLGDVKIIVRCEVNAWSNKSGEDKFINTYALNEWDPKYTGGAWRQKIDSQRGAVLATEVKNNSGKFAKWVAQSLLSGVDLMKVGYVSRVTASNPYDHVLLATQIFKPKELATQINLTLANVWGIVKMMCDILLKKEDGKYVILKDPSKPVIRVYAVPMNTFEEEYEEEEEEEEDDEEAEVDGEEDVAEDPEEVIMVVVE